MTAASDTTNLGWLLADLADRVPGVAHATAVSADGLLIAASEQLPDGRAGQLSAIIAGLVSLTYGATRVIEWGDVVQSVVEMDKGFLFLMAIGDGSTLGVLAAHGCDVGQVAFEMARLTARVGGRLDPSPRPRP
ncbi:roadblock/LC7 domain-containing protein [Longispora sp. NPDC051575]|uniref:roadblock/LC7 domain-containing protein n=1 Tax=Longispora sp. NPDC051575 TaxID=3154943 RepID=UPI00342EBE80